MEPWTGPTTSDCTTIERPTRPSRGSRDRSGEGLDGAHGRGEGHIRGRRRSRHPRGVARDSAADERETARDRAEFMSPGASHVGRWPERRDAGFDRAEAKNDRAASLEDRIALTEDPEHPEEAAGH